VLKGNSDFTVDPDWNDAAVTFTGLKLNVTDTASASGSSLLDLQVNGTSEAKISGGELSLGTLCSLSKDGLNLNNQVSIDVPGAGQARIVGRASTELCWTSDGSNTYANRDLVLARDSAGVLAVTDGSTGTGYIKQDPVAVSALPAAATVGAGTRGFVNDANATTFASVVAGGGANTVPVYSDGTNWLIG